MPLAAVANFSRPRQVRSTMTPATPLLALRRRRLRVNTSAVLLVLLVAALNPGHHAVAADLSLAEVLRTNHETAIAPTPTPVQTTLKLSPTPAPIPLATDFTPVPTSLTEPPTPTPTSLTEPPTPAPTLLAAPTPAPTALEVAPTPMATSFDWEPRGPVSKSSSVLADTFYMVESTSMPTVKEEGAGVERSRVNADANPSSFRSIDSLPSSSRSEDASGSLFGCSGSAASDEVGCDGNTYYRRHFRPWNDSQSSSHSGSGDDGEAIELPRSSGSVVAVVSPLVSGVVVVVLTLGLVA